MTFAERLQLDSAIWAPRHTSSSKFSIINPVTAPELSASTIEARMSARSGPHWRCGQTMCAPWSRVASGRSCQCTGRHDMGGISRQKELEALWRHNRATRKKVLTRSELLKLSLQQLQKVPAQLRRPDKVHGIVRPKGLRGSAVFQYLLQLSVVWRDERFDHCISALF